MDKGFWTQRWEAFLDNAIFYGVVALVGVVVAAGFLGEDVTSVPLWIVVLFVGILLGTVIAVAVLFQRLRGESAVQTVVAPQPAPAPAPAPKHPHVALLGRIKALNSSLGDLDMKDAIERAVAETYNGILLDAQNATQDSVLSGMRTYQVLGDDMYANSGQLGGLRLQLEQIAAIVEHSE